jgi:MFS family permease
MQYLTRAVWVLSLLSLFTDISSEMLYPVMPLYLSAIGFGAGMIGLLEGLAEAVAGISKGYFGAMSDHKGTRLPFVQIGYGLSAISKPLMAVCAMPIWILGARATDRLGKGIRTGARDALLSAECSPENKGKVFGFHRAMDTLGAAIGPMVALLLLYLYPGQYRMIFLIAFIPAVIGLGITLLTQDKPVTPNLNRKYSFWASFDYLSIAPSSYKRLMVGLMAFAFFNSSDLFLLLKMKSSGLNEQYVIGAYIFYNLIYAMSSFPAGMIADKVGLKNVFVFGLLLFAVSYYLIATAEGRIEMYFIAFIVYGMYAATTEGIAKALVSNIVPQSETGSALGSYAGMSSVIALFSSVMTGLIWQYGSAEAALLLSVVGALLAALYLTLIKV